MKLPFRSQSIPGKALSAVCAMPLNSAASAIKEKKLTFCGKTNVLTYAFDLWQRTFNAVGQEYPDIAPDYANVDAICMWMVKNPEWFDVIVTDNMFGDIITDLAAMIQGGVGVAAGGNINPAVSPCLSRWADQHPNIPGRMSSTPLQRLLRCR